MGDASLMVTDTKVVHHGHAVKDCCFELLLQDVVLVRSPMGKEFSANPAS